MRGKKELVHLPGGAHQSRILSICVMNFNETGCNVSQSISIARWLNDSTHLQWEKREKEKKVSMKCSSVIISMERRKVLIHKKRSEHFSNRFNGCHEPKYFHCSIERMWKNSPCQRIWWGEFINWSSSGNYLIDSLKCNELNAVRCS